MYLRVVSDVHVEWGQAFEITPLPRDPETVLILAGDIDSAGNLQQTITKIIDNTEFLAYIIIPGNHEYYGQDFNMVQQQFDDLRNYFNLKVEYSNVWFTSTADTIQVGDTTFIFGPMWTDGGNTDRDRRITQGSLSDFRVIRDGLSAWSVDRMRVEFFKFISYLNEALKKVTTPKCVLVTHHLPTYKAIAPEFKHSDCNGGFASDIIKYIQPDLLDKIDVMCFGHTHTTVKKKVILEIGTKKVQLICNPRGYPKQWLIDMDPVFDNEQFDPTLTFDLTKMRFV